MSDSGGNFALEEIPMHTTDTHDSDASDFLAVPVWYDRHPSQAEGEDY